MSCFAHHHHHHLHSCNLTLKTRATNSHSSWPTSDCPVVPVLPSARLREQPHQWNWPPVCAHSQKWAIIKTQASLKSLKQGMSPFEKDFLIADSCKPRQIISKNCALRFPAPPGQDGHPHEAAFGGTPRESAPAAPREQLAIFQPRTSEISKKHILIMFPWHFLLCS